MISHGVCRVLTVLWACPSPSGGTVLPSPSPAGPASASRRRKRRNRSTGAWEGPAGLPITFGRHRTPAPLACGSSVSEPQAKAKKPLDRCMGRPSGPAHHPRAVSEPARTRFPASHKRASPIRGNPASPPIPRAPRWGRQRVRPSTQKRGHPNWISSFTGAGNEARTRYLHLGKVALYQMSYAREQD